MSASTSNRSLEHRVSIQTLGCKVNLFESEYISSRLQSQKWTDSLAERPELCIINTCTVTREADRQSRQTIRRTIRDNPDATILVTGCYAEMQPAECARIPGVDYVVPGTSKLKIPELVAGEISIESLTAKPGRAAGTLMPEQAIAGFESRTRANLQVQQGCDNGCTFCIIHQARGASRSVSPTTVVRQVESYVRQGFAEVVICGIDLGSYGEDLSGEDGRIDLAALTDELATRYPECRFRWSSIDPAHITPGLIEVLRRHDNICPHIHLSLQSAAPIILKRMKRRYQPDDVAAAVTALRNARKDLILSADIMAGFPTESEADFELTRKAIHELEIVYPHVFAYSERNGTPAARIPKQVPAATRKNRARILRDAGNEVREQVLARYVGRTDTVLVEGRLNQGDGFFRARLQNYLPVYFKSAADLSGQLVRTHLSATFRDGLLGSVKN